MKKIFNKTIVLIGDPKKGKTPTIKISAGIVEKLYNPKDVKSGEIVVVIKRIINKNKCQIKRTYVFISVGDSLKELKKAVKKALKLDKHIDVMICASHPRNLPSGIDCLDYIYSISKNVVEIRKTIATKKSDEQRVNAEDAEKIYKELDK